MDLERVDGLELRRIPVRLGRDAHTGEDVELDMAAPAHALIQGMTRSGKSVAAYNLLGHLVDAASVGAVRVCGCDPSRLLLSPWAGVGRGRVALGADYGGMVALLEDLKSEMDARNAGLVARGVDKISAFSQVEPLLVVVVEELPGIVAGMGRHDAGQKPADRLAPRFAALLGEVLAQGAKAGVRVVAIAQRASTEVVAGDTRSNFGTRITFAVKDRESVKMVFPDLDDERARRVRRLPPGRALVETAAMREPREMIGDFVPDYTTYLRRCERLGTNDRVQPDAGASGRKH